MLIRYKVTEQKGGDKKSLNNSEKVRLFYCFFLKRRLFHVLQLVCGQDLRSFTGKTYIRLWNTLACACEQDIIASVQPSLASVT